MANPILSSAAFATANMKPVPDEQIDALWGQNIADNTGALKARPMPVYHFDNASFHDAYTTPGGIKTLQATTWYDKLLFCPTGHNTFEGTFNTTATHSTGNTYDNYGTIQWGIYGDLGTYINYVRYSAMNTDGYARSDSYATRIPLGAYVSEGSWARFRITGMGTTTDPDTAGNDHYLTADSFKVKTLWV